MHVECLPIMLLHCLMALEGWKQCSYSWHMFQDADWYGVRGRDTHMSWRYAASELRKRAECAAAAETAGPASKRRK